MSDWDSSSSDDNDLDTSRDQPDTPAELLEILKQKYKDPQSDIGYTDVSSIYRYFRGKLPYKDIYKFLSTTDGYTLTKRVKKPRIFNMTYSSRLRQNLQVDVFFMQEFKKENDNFMHILVGVDVWSRFMWVCPLRNTSAVEGVRGVEHIFSRMGQLPENLTADKGSEFVSKKFRSYLKSRNVTLHHIVEPNPRKL